MMVGQALSQGLIFVSLPFITRYFSPEEVGLWSVLQSIAVLAWSFASLRSDISIIQAKDEEEVDRIYAVGTTVLLLTLIPVVVGAYWWLPAHFSSLGAIVMLAMYVVGFGQNQLIQSKLLKKGAFDRLIVVRLVSVLLTYPLAVLSGFLNVALVCGVWLPILWIKEKVRTRTFWHPKAVAWYFSRFRGNAIFSTLHTWFSTLSDQFFLLLVGAYFAPAYAAAFFIASRFCTAPISLMVGSIGQYNLKKYQSDMDAGTFSIRQPITHWLTWLPVSLVYYGLIGWLGKDGAQVLLGDSWGVAGEMAIWLALPNFLIFLTSPTSCGFSIVQKQQYTLWLSIGPVLRLLFSWAAMHYWHDPVFAVAVYAVTEFLYTFVFNGTMLWAIHSTTCTSSLSRPGT